ncbi:SUMF1/EgtB/PvdO family nonheme iron enzyme [Flammeovirga sp. OC4]|uniref:SUMF1/EgtB/PvdO family nonheme iron enzyme n=1 Tax=Flammeovirga sp. OC4 TaxID=1382345 RepID=UPI0005C62A1D|nr:SUMF1/EgtB/PvdO family nonheme iron enzyme [Flammeovirga sp. OC4]
MNKNTTFYFLVLFLPYITEANNLQITVNGLTNKSTSNKTVQIDVDVTWDNSWRVSSAQNNWDAVWLFVKFRNTNNDYWQHATLSYGNGHTVTGGGTAESDDDTGTGFSKGVFVYSNAAKTQSTANYNVLLEWQYGEDAQGDDDTFEVIVYGIEMVYVPQGRYSLGTGGNESFSFFMYYGDINIRNKPYVVTSEDAITVGTEYGNLCYVNTSSNAGTYRDGDLNASFPKGYQGFYCMKYEITQGQYVDFLNSLTSDQVGNNNRVTAWYGTNRNTISESGGTYSADNPNLPLIYSSHFHIYNYLDWACLRPMSELEYEKACRGTLDPVNNEYAWGTTTINTTAYATEGTLENENITSATYAAEGNCTISESNGAITGPTRVGIHATSTSGRAQSGASYYGIMDLTGSAYEVVVGISLEEGRNFDGSHGDGLLDNFGYYSQSGWPQMTVGDVGGLRGGSFNTTEDHGIVSVRKLMGESYDTATSSRDFVGGRGVRTAPKN